MIFICIQPLVIRIKSECSLAFNRWYPNDGNLLGTTDAAQKELELLVEVGIQYQFFIIKSTTTAYLPKLTEINLRPLQTVIPFRPSLADEMEVLGAPIGFDRFMKDSFM